MVNRWRDISLPADRTSEHNCQDPYMDGRSLGHESTDGDRLNLVILGTRCFPSSGGRHPPRWEHGHARHDLGRSTAVPNKPRDSLRQASRKRFENGFLYRYDWAMKRSQIDTKIISGPGRVRGPQSSRPKLPHMENWRCCNRERGQSPYAISHKDLHRLP